MSILKQIVKTTLNRCGFDIKRLSCEPLMHQNAYLAQRDMFGNFEVPTIFDVGANLGQSVLEYRKYFSGSNIYCFEPTNDAFEMLKNNWMHDKNVQMYNAAITNRNGDVGFYTNKANFTNSLLKVSCEADAIVDSSLLMNMGCITVKGVTLDKFCLNNRVNKINILKMDIQGGELMALEGARRLLEANLIDVIYSEVLFANIYDNQAYFCDINGYLRNHNYSLYGLFNLTYGDNGLLAWGDALYVSSSMKEIRNRKS